LGKWIGSKVAEALILTGFALMMLLVGIRMWRQKSDTSETPTPAESGGLCERNSDGDLVPGIWCIAALVVTGFFVGVLSGVFGVGGGFLIVPALVLVSGLGIHRAVATSLLVISLICVAGVASFIWQGDAIPLQLSLFFIGGGLLGMLLGGSLRKRFSPVMLRRVFAASMWSVGLFILTQNLVIADEKENDPVILQKDAVPGRVIETGKEASKALATNLKAMLSATIKDSGPVEAIKVCNHAAGPAAEAVTRQFEGRATVRRTALRVRNPQNKPDATDLFILRYLEELLRGEEEIAGTVITGPVDGIYRHYQPLLTQKLCLTCHGDPEAMPEGLRAVIAKRYPDDEATGFKLEDLRGVIRVDIPEKPVQ